MTPPELPPLPNCDPKQCIPYDAIRYVAGYDDTYVKRYALAYAAQCLEAAATHLGKEADEHMKWKNWQAAGVLRQACEDLRSMAAQKGTA